MKEMYNKVWIQKRADPYVYKHTDGTYYFTASLPDYDGIALRKADRLFDKVAFCYLIFWYGII